MRALLTQHRCGFPKGRTVITRSDEKTLATGMDFSILKLSAGEVYSFCAEKESALLHLQGDLSIEIEGKTYRNHRSSVFDEPPFAVHCAQGAVFTLKACSDLECAVIETPNPHDFPTAVYESHATPNEHRGKNMLEDTSYRYVRTIFDGKNSHPHTALVLGEVVNFPGRWSSYPPHHHPHPEIYHYRFSDPRGYGHAELGEEVYKVKSYDTLKILDSQDHSQCSAPGYAMYYIWVIRHLPENRYDKPEFTDEHQWLMETIK